MRKILFLITQAEMGGAQKYILELSYSLKKLGYEVLVASEKNESFKQKLSENSIKFIELKHIQRNINPFSDFSVFSEILKLIKLEKPDIVHLNSSKIGVLGALAGRLAKAPRIIFTAHGWVFNETLPFYKKWLYVFLSWLSANFQDKIICVSNYDKNKAIKYHIATEEKLVVINNGINENKLNFLTKEDARKSLKLPEDKIIIGDIANLYKNKGIVYLVEAAKEIIKENKNIIFAIIGDGPEKANLKKLITKYNLKAHFFLLGKKDDASKYLKAFDIFILPSQKEGFPYVLLEAGLAETPVITTNVGGIPDLIKKDNGVSIMSKNKDQIISSILNLLKNKEKQKFISINLHKDVCTKFMLKSMVEKTRNIYRI